MLPGRDSVGQKGTKAEQTGCNLGFVDLFHSTMERKKRVLHQLRLEDTTSLENINWSIYLFAIYFASYLHYKVSISGAIIGTPLLATCNTCTCAHLHHVGGSN